MEHIIIKDSRLLYQDSGDRFLVKGIQYQDFSNDLNSSTIIVDPLEDGARCTRDIPYLKELGINTLYVLHIRPQSNHADCMNQLRDAGIYVLLNLGGKLGTESRTFRWEYPLADRFRTIVTEFSTFSNTLGFRIVGSIPKFIPFTKAAVRDLKSFLKERKLRSIPIGFDSFEGIPNDPVLYEQLICGGEATAVDFLFYSPDFEGCLDAKNFGDTMNRVRTTKTTLPIVLSGTACDIEPKANKTLLSSAYTEDYLSTHSGALLYNYFDNDFAIMTTRSGLVQIQSGNVIKRPMFELVTNDFAKINSSASGEVVPSSIPINQPPCSSVLTFQTATKEENKTASTTTLQLASNLPPVPNKRLCNCMIQSLECIQKENTTYDKTPSNKPNFLITGLETEISALYDRVCNGDMTDIRCIGSTTDTSTGRYGAFSVCNNTQRTSWVLNQHYISQNRSQLACSSMGGKSQNPIENASKQCQYLLRQSEPHGTGAVLYNLEENQSNGTSKSGKLSNKGKAGIGIAVSLSVLFVVIALIFHCRRRRAISSLSDSFGKAELPDSSVATRKQEVSEIDGTTLHESGNNDLLEASPTDIVELPATYNELVELDAEEKRSLKKFEV